MSILEVGQEGVSDVSALMHSAWFALIPSSSGCSAEYFSASHFSGWVALILVRCVNGLCAGAPRWPL